MLLKNKNQTSIMDIGLFPLVGQYMNKVIKAISDGLLLSVIFLFGPRGSNNALDELDKWYIRVTVGSAIGTASLAIIAFIGNFNLVADLAYANGIPYPMAYLIPLALDGFVMISILIVLGAALVGEKARMIKFLVFLASLTGVYFNVSNVIATGELALMSLLLHSVLGAMLYLAVEVTAHQITSFIRRKSALRTNEKLQGDIEEMETRKINIESEVDLEYNRLLNEAKRKEQSELQPILDQVEAAKDELSRVMAQVEKESSRDDNYTQDDVKTAYLMGQDNNATGKAIAKLIGKSPAHGNSLKRKIKPLLNGH